MSGGKPRRNTGFGLTIPRVDTDVVSALCAVNRQLAMRIDELIDIMKRVAPAIVPEVATQENIADLLRLLLASMPADHQVVTVGTTPTWLAENFATLGLPVLITNYDVAQKLRYGTSTVMATGGPLIDTEATEKIVIPANQSLYGLVPAATIQVAVSRLVIPG